MILTVGLTVLDFNTVANAYQCVHVYESGGGRECVI